MHFVVWFPGHPPILPTCGRLSFPQNEGRKKSPDGLPFPHFGGKGPEDGGLYPAQVHNTL